MNGTSDVPHEPGRATGSDDDTGPVAVVGHGASRDEPDRGPDTGPVLPAAGRRHRPAPGTWTPPVGGGGACHARTEPIPPITSPRTSDVEFGAASGVLPPPDDIPAPERPGVRRRRVLLTDARVPGDENVRAIRPRGLGKFDLGSVPASVTPPRSWRKAAWFASAASGAAVAAMLVVGTAFVSDPAEGPRALQTWPEHSSRQPTLPGNGGNDNPRTGARNTTEPDDDRREAAAGDVETVPAAHRRNDSAPASGGDHAVADDEPGDIDSVPGTVAPTPSKPPVTPAPTDSAPVVLWAPHDGDTLAQRSQDYFNTVTEDPDAAHALTTGELAAQGPDGLASKYSDVAYFEVREVYVDPHEGYTLNTVEVTYVDGTSEQQTRKLVFSDDDLIAADTL